MGRVGKTTRDRVLAKTGGVCSHCGTSLKRSSFCVSHINPVTIGGTQGLWNLVPLCQDCVKLRGGRLVMPEWFAYMNEGFAEWMTKKMLFIHGEGYNDMVKEDWGELT